MTSSFDSIAAFDEKGTAYVLFGAEDPRLAAFVAPTSRMTVARSEDLGQTWKLFPFAEIPTPIRGHDFMDLAVAPDDGTLYVGTNIILAGMDPVFGRPGPIWFYRSTDRGETWQGPLELSPLTPPTGRYPWNVRLSAGPGGLVVAAAYASDPGRDGAKRGHFVWVSKDGGRTFGEPQLVDDAPGSDEASMQPVIAWTDDGAPRVDIVYTTNGTIERVFSSDRGATWTPRRVVGVFPTDSWGMVYEAAGGRDGTTYILDSYGLYSPYRFNIGLIALTSDGGVPVRTAVVESAPGLAAPYAGGDYGGISVGADGSIWMAWGDPSGPGPVPIAVVRLVPNLV